MKMNRFYLEYQSPLVKIGRMLLCGGNLSESVLIFSLDFDILIKEFEFFAQNYNFDSGKGTSV